MIMRLNLDAISEIVHIFSKSNNVSYMKGRTHFIMSLTNNAKKSVQKLKWTIKKKRPNKSVKLMQ